MILGFATHIAPDEGGKLVLLVGAHSFARRDDTQTHTLARKLLSGIRDFRISGKQCLKFRGRVGRGSRVHACGSVLAHMSHNQYPGVEDC